MTLCVCVTRGNRFISAENSIPITLRIAISVKLVSNIGLIIPFFCSIYFRHPKVGQAHFGGCSLPATENAVE